MASTRPLVLVLGATGQTGQSIVDGLINSGNFRVAALVRPASLAGKATEKLRESGVEIRTGDLTDEHESLKEAVKGVEIIISAVSAWILDRQKDIFRAAKEVGVKRVVPGDWAGPGAKGVRSLHDTKLAIRDFVKDLGVGYTFIDVGWWMQIALPLPLRSAAPPPLKEMTWQIHGTGQSRILVTDLRHIGTYVARIVADLRTLNHAVIIWEDEVAEHVAHEIGERISGEGADLKVKRILVSGEELEKWQAAAKAEIAQDPSNIGAHLKLTWADNMYSMHILQENTLENAKKLGYLDARELYPDVPKHTLEEYAKEYYSLPEPGVVFSKDK